LSFGDKLTLNKSCWGHVM